MSETIEHNLIIIGNGFDLNCGLNTRYSDFFYSRIKALKQVDSLFLKSFTSSDHELGKISISEIFTVLNISICPLLNAWDIIFLANSSNDTNTRWCDIEEEMLHFLLPETSHVKTRINFADFDYALKFITRNTEERLRNKNVNKLNYFLAVYCIQTQKLTDNSDITNEKLMNWFLHELRLFEVNFQSFVKNQHLESKYYTKAHLLLEKLNFNELKYVLLNFNYTRPDKDYRKELSKNIINISNVHGNIYDQSILFGIDHVNIHYSDIVYNFTKTSRKIFNFQTSTSETGVLSKGIQNIIVFGHSLNNADYSYYQSIFDYCDLYHSNVSLIFNYSVFDKSKIEQIKADRFLDVIKLINSYGETMNVYHGKNLLHKLMLENRLHILEI